MGEVIDGMCAMIDNPEIPLEGLMEHIKGPDFPTGGIIMGRSGIRSAYATGRGKIVVRARAEIVEEKNGRFKIIVTELYTPHFFSDSFGRILTNKKSCYIMTAFIGG